MVDRVREQTPLSLKATSIIEMSEALHLQWFNEISHKQNLIFAYSNGHKKHKYFRVARIYQFILLKVNLFSKRDV